MAYITTLISVFHNSTVTGVVYSHLIVLKYYRAQTTARRVKQARADQLPLEP